MPDRIPPDLQELVSIVRRRILVVDDDEDGAHTIARIFECFGQDVRIVTDSTQAISIAIDFKPHVAILDLEMPKITGMDLALQLRNIPGFEDIGLIALSGHVNHDVFRRCREFGFNRFFAKPPPLDQIFFALLEY